MYRRDKEKAKQKEKVGVNMKSASILKPSIIHIYRKEALLAQDIQTQPLGIIG